MPGEPRSFARCKGPVFSTRPSVKRTGGTASVQVANTGGLQRTHFIPQALADGRSSLCPVPPSSAASSVFPQAPYRLITVPGLVAVRRRSLGIRECSGGRWHRGIKMPGTIGADPRSLCKDWDPTHTSSPRQRRRLWGTLQHGDITVPTMVRAAPVPRAAGVRMHSGCVRGERGL